MTAAVGPLGQVLSASDQGVALENQRVDLNLLIVLRRAAFLDQNGAVDKSAVRGTFRWASLKKRPGGQDRKLVRAVAARRQRAAESLAGAGYHAVAVDLRPQWRMVVGLGDEVTAYETSLTLHGTYGWPVIPATALKGVTRAQARDAVSEDEQRELLGAPKPGAREEAQKGAVTFLDAGPLQPVTLTTDVMTPHVAEYYQDQGCKQPPAEWYQPVPVEFLAVESGTFRTFLLGRDVDAVTAAAELLRKAVNELGVGAKTSAGYGYLDADEAGRLTPPDPKEIAP